MNIVITSAFFPLNRYPFLNGMMGKGDDSQENLQLSRFDAWLKNMPQREMGQALDAEGKKGIFIYMTKQLTNFYLTHYSIRETSSALQLWTGQTVGANRGEFDRTERWRSLAVQFRSGQTLIWTPHIYMQHKACVRLVVCVH